VCRQLVEPARDTLQVGEHESETRSEREQERRQVGQPVAQAGLQEARILLRLHQRMDGPHQQRHGRHAERDRDRAQRCLGMPAMPGDQQHDRYQLSRKHHRNEAGARRDRLVVQERDGQCRAHHQCSLPARRIALEHEAAHGLPDQEDAREHEAVPEDDRQPSRCEGTRQQGDESRHHAPGAHTPQSQLALVAQEVARERQRDTEQAERQKQRDEDRRKVQCHHAVVREPRRDPLTFLDPQGKPCRTLP
jgi:hypothetical protein